jgi:predicted alpha/beta hydrolase
MTMTEEEFKSRIVDLARRIGPKAEVWVLMRSAGTSAIGVYPKADEYKNYLSFGAEKGWEAAFAAADAWLAARPDPDAEWRSWQTAA